jgi:hypothetical protein
MGSGKLTSHLHLVPRKRTHGPLRHSLHGMVLKQNGNFTFLIMLNLFYVSLEFVSTLSVLFSLLLLLYLAIIIINFLIVIK